MHMTRRAAASTALAALLLLASCGSDGGSDDAASTTTKPAGSTVTSTTAAATDTTVTDTTEAPTETTAAANGNGGGGGITTTTESSEGRDTETSQLDTLEPDGDHYGYLAGLENGTVEGQAVQVVIWDEVEFLTGQAAVDAAAEDGQTLETDYYIRNENQTVRRLAVVPEASVTSLDGGSADPVPSSVDEVWQQEYLFKINVGTVRGITTVSGIAAVYLP